MRKQFNIYFLNDQRELFNLLPASTKAVVKDHDGVFIVQEDGTYVKIDQILDVICKDVKNCFYIVKPTETYNHIGKLCWFWKNEASLAFEGKCVGILRKMYSTPAGIFYESDRGEMYVNCEPLTSKEIEVLKSGE